MAFRKFILIYSAVFSGLFLAVTAPLQAGMVDEGTVSISARVAPENTIIFSGDACPLCQVFLLMDGVLTDSGTALADGSFQISVEDIDAGEYIFGVYVIDADSTQSGATSFTVSVSQGTLTYVSDILIPPTLKSDASSVEKGDDLTLSGYTVPDSDVTINLNDGKTIIQVSSASDGGFYYALDTSSLRIGTHSAKARVTTATNVSNYGRIVEFEVERASSSGGESGTTGSETSSESETSDEDEEDEEDEDEEEEEDVCKAADYNGNRKINIVDFSILLHWYGKGNVPGSIDLNDDNKVNITDFSILVYCWTG